MFDLARLAALRERCFKCIDREIALDGHHKSYEGAIDIRLGNRWAPDEISLELHCYVAPVNGRGEWFESLDEFEEFLSFWERLLSAYEAGEEDSVSGVWKPFRERLKLK